MRRCGMMETIENKEVIVTVEGINTVIEDDIEGTAAVIEKGIKPIGVYAIEDGKNIFVYSIVKGREDDRIILGDDFSGRNPRSFKLYSNTKGLYFLYRCTKVYLMDVTTLV